MDNKLPMTFILIPAIAMIFYAGTSNANDNGHHSHSHADADFGIKVEKLLKEKSIKLFGVKQAIK